MVFDLNRVSAVQGSLAAGATATFYGYADQLNADNALPLEIVEDDNIGPFIITTLNDGATVPRQFRVLVYNPTAGALAVGLNLWMRVP